MARSASGRETRAEEARGDIPAQKSSHVWASLGALRAAHTPRVYEIEVRGCIESGARGQRKNRIDESEREKKAARAASVKRAAPRPAMKRLTSVR
jgi:hypothetical protein